MISKIKVASKILNLKIIGISFFIIILGIILLSVSLALDLEESRIWHSILIEIGSLLLVSSITSLIWEIWLKRNFLDEILAKISLKKDMTKTGILNITKSFKQIEDIVWKKYFNSVKEMDLFFCYAYTWRNHFSEEFTELAQKQGFKLRVILPNPDSSLVVNSLAQRFNYQPDHIVDRIKDALDFFKRIKNSYNTDIELWLIDEPPVHSLYRFDNEMIIATFKHRKVKEISVPAFICNNSGTIYHYYLEEFEDLMKRGTKIL